MQLDTFIGIACMVLFVICCAGYRYFSENVWLKC